jgi:RNA polymerase sigma-70 factor (ECF subfamily)
MKTRAKLHRADAESLDGDLVVLARRGDAAAIRELIRRNNQRLFRAARAVLRDDAEAEDVVQETYVKAFSRLDGFEGRSAFSTWLTRIAINEALSRRRRRRPTADLEAVETAEQRGGELIPFPGAAMALSPEAMAMRGELTGLLEELIDALPTPFRLAFVLREVEGLSTEEVAEQLGIKPATVKTRLFRAKRLLRAAIESRFAQGFAAVFPFDGARCVRMADRVMARLGAGQ